MATITHQGYLIDQTPGTATARLFSALLEAFLLVFALAAAAGMLAHLGPLQPLTWLMCYALVFLLLGVRFPSLLGALLNNRFVVSFPLVAAMSAAWSYSPGASFYAAFQLLVTTMIGVYIGWRFSLTLILKTFAVLGTIAAALSVLHGATGLFPWSTHNNSGGLAGIYQHKNMLGSRSLYATTIIVALLLLRRNEPGWTPAPTLYLALSICLVGLVLALSATALVLLPVLVGGVLLLAMRRVPPLMAIIALGLLILSVALVPLFFAAMGIDPIKALFDALGKDTTLTGRTNLWDIARNTWGDHPLLGVGYRAFWMAPEFATGRSMTYAAGARDALGFHNFLLDAVVSTGIFGVICLALWFVTAAYRLWTLFSVTRNPVPAAGLMLIVGLFVTGMLTTSLTRGHEISFLLLAALTVAAGEDLRQVRQKQL